MILHRAHNHLIITCVFQDSDYGGGEKLRKDLAKLEPLVQLSKEQRELQQVY